MRVEKIAINNGFQKSINNTNDKTVDFPPVKEENKDINLNQDPKSLAFQGLFFNKNKKPDEAKPEPKTAQEPGIYGPYKLTASQIAANDKEADYFIKTVTNIIKTENPKIDVVLTNAANRAKGSDMKYMADVTLSCFCYYTKSSTSFPQFYDSMVRALPKACAKSDKHNKTDNATRLYERIMQKAEALGKMTNPNSEDPIKDGITYLYFSDDLPAFDIADDENSTYDTLKNMENGKRPTLYKTYSHPKCHMSTVANEIDVYGNDYIKRHYGREKLTDNGKRITTNYYGSIENLNFKYKPKPKIEPIYETYEEPIDLEAFVGEMLRGIF